MTTESVEAGASLLDRLIDENPSRSTDPVRTRDQIRQEIREGVQRDISILLSSRSWLGTWPRELDRVKTSIVNFGLPDVTGVAIGSEDVQEILRVTVQMALQAFEPRLTATEVMVVSPPGSRTAQVVIQGLVRNDHEPVMFGGGLARSSLSDLSKEKR